jgi:hypothetical protein
MAQASVIDGWLWKSEKWWTQPLAGATFQNYHLLLPAI